MSSLNFKIALSGAALVVFVIPAPNARAQDDKPTLVFAPRPQTPVPNGFDLYLQAAQSVQDAKPFIDPNSDTESLSLSPEQKRERYSLARRLIWEHSNARAWTLFEQAKRARSLHPLKRSLKLPWPNYGGLRQLARDKAALANTRVLQGKWNEALQNDVDVIEMGHDIERGGGIIAMLVGDAISAIGARQTWRANPFGERSAKGIGLGEDVVAHLNAREAREAALRLEGLIGNVARFSDILREDKAITQTQWLQTWDEPQPGTKTFGKTLLRVSPRVPQQRALFDAYSRTADAFITRADRPVSAVKWWPDLEINVVALPSYSPKKYAILYASARAREEQVLLRLALRAYQLEHGAFPSQLSVLSPRFLRHVPVDPFGSGEAWRYKNGVAWSIGPDERDDGGQVLHRKNGDFTPIDFMSPDVLGDVVAKP